MADYRQRQRGAASRGVLSIAAAVSIAVAALAAPLIAKWEGVRYEPYRDTVGVLTVCYGHTGSDIVPGKRYTKAECEQLLQADIAIANAAVNRCLPMPKFVHVEAALTSAAFNLGPKVVCGSTLQRLALANDWPGACAELDRWKNAGGRELRGLVLRRADERAMCEGRQ
ncbi:endolysin [Stenotrophomonas pictorum JCM 9942]|uniref:Lysozyme n=3 Tax=Stenotrophomonas pictorum TaxID=86184 RepID=A0A0R0ABX4_9GAMM|nr:endolysin [Stenotrophomonas pictorum JCM 9942]